MATFSKFLYSDIGRVLDRTSKRFIPLSNGPQDLFLQDPGHAPSHEFRSPFGNARTAPEQSALAPSDAIIAHRHRLFRPQGTTIPLSSPGWVFFWRFESGVTLLSGFGSTIFFISIGLRCILEVERIPSGITAPGARAWSCFGKIFSDSSWSAV
jgi:hypothetical protein